MKITRSSRYVIHAEHAGRSFALWIADGEKWSDDEVRRVVREKVDGVHK